jgi:hypothetical protein
MTAPPGLGRGRGQSVLIGFKWQGPRRYCGQAPGPEIGHLPVADQALSSSCSQGDHSEQLCGLGLGAACEVCPATVS